MNWVWEQNPKLPNLKRCIFIFSIFKIHCQVSHPMAICLIIMMPSLTLLNSQSQQNMLLTPSSATSVSQDPTPFSKPVENSDLFFVNLLIKSPTLYSMDLPWTLECNTITSWHIVCYYMMLPGQMVIYYQTSWLGWNLQHKKNTNLRWSFVGRKR